MMAMLASALEADSAPMELTETPAAPPDEAKGRGDTFIKGNDRAKLRMKVAHFAADHPAALRTALRQAPETVQSALLRAIAVSEAGYEKALEALD